MKVITESRMERQRQWKRRLEEARVYPGGLAEYCQKAGVTLSALNYWRNKFRIRPAPSQSVQRAAFVPVQIFAAENRACGPKLPDPKWLADLIRHLTAASGEDGR